jgi:hypothetical protein
MARALKYILKKLKKRVPRKYYSMINIFIKEEANQLPPYCPEDHDIQLINGAKPPFSQNYRPTNIQEYEVILKYIKEQLGKGFI